MILSLGQLVSLAAVTVALTGVTASEAPVKMQEYCPGTPKTVRTLDDLLVPGVKKRLVGEKSFEITKGTVIAPSLSNFGCNLELLFFHNDFVKKPATFSIAGNYGETGCYLGDFLVEREGTILMHWWEQIHLGGLYISTTARPFRRVDLRDKFTIHLIAERFTKRFVKIMPAEEFRNRNTFVLYDQNIKPKLRDIYEPINMENQLGTIRRNGASLINEGVIVVRQTSLSILSNFKRGRRNGEIHLSQGQLILLMDNYDGSASKLLEGQKIYFTRDTSTVFFGRNMYSNPETVFAASLEGCGDGDAIVFEDKVESGKYDPEKKTLTVNIKSPNGLRPFTIRVNSSQINGMEIVDTHPQVGKFENGSMVLWM